MSQRAQWMAEVGVMAALLEAAKIALSALPNIELVSLLILVFTLRSRKKALCAVLVFIALECCLWGIQLWTAMYVFVWPVLVLLISCLRTRSNATLALASGVFGLSFGALCSVLYFFVGGAHMAFAWWVSGIPWDLVHGASNFVLALLLLPRLRALLRV